MNPHLMPNMKRGCLWEKTKKGIKGEAGVEGGEGIRMNLLLQHLVVDRERSFVQKHLEK